MKALGLLYARVRLVPFVLLVACSSEEPEQPQPQPLRVVADALPTGAVIVLRPRLEGTLLLVDVVGRDVPDLSGLALRIEHPKWARFEGRDADKGWAAESVHRTKSPNDHEVALVDTGKGKAAGHPGGPEAPFTTLRFRVEGAPTSGDLGRIHVVPIRSEARGAAGDVVKLSFADARFLR